MPLCLIWHPPPFIPEHQEVAHLWWYLLLISRQPFAAVSCEPDPRICKRQRQLFRHPFATSKPHMNKSKSQDISGLQLPVMAVLGLGTFLVQKCLGHFAWKVPASVTLCFTSLYPTCALETHEKKRCEFVEKHRVMTVTMDWLAGNCWKLSFLMSFVDGSMLQFQRLRPLHV